MWPRSRPLSSQSMTSTTRSTRSTSSTLPKTPVLWSVRPGPSASPNPTSPDPPRAGCLRLTEEPPQVNVLAPLLLWRGGPSDRTIGNGQPRNPRSRATRPGTPSRPPVRASPFDRSAPRPVGGTEPRRGAHRPHQLRSRAGRDPQPPGWVARDRDAATRASSVGDAHRGIDRDRFHDPGSHRTTDAAGRGRDLRGTRSGLARGQTQQAYLLGWAT